MFLKILTHLFLLYLLCLLTHTHLQRLQLIGHLWKFTSIANDYYLTPFPEPRAGARSDHHFWPNRVLSEGALLPELGGTPGASLPSRTRGPQPRVHGDASGFTFVGSFLDMTPEVEVRRCEVQRPRWPPGGGASGDELPLKRSCSHSRVSVAALAETPSCCSHCCMGTVGGPF